MSHMTKSLMAVIAVLLSAALFTCAGSPAASGGSSKPEGPAFTGDGGKGKSIAIIAPRAAGLAENQNYIPALVQGELVSNFTSYSAITVLDRMRLDEQYAELLSGYYSDDAPKSWDLGRLNPTGYLMLGTVTRTGSGYALQISITDNTDKSTVASYSATVSAAELDNLGGVRKASLDLMQKMGVTPTERTKTSLSGAAAASEVNAQRALSQGIAAQKGGNEYQAMINYFEARTFNPVIPEASARITSAGTTLAANNGQNTGARAQVLGEIARMREADRLEAERVKNIEAVLEKASTFYRVHQPYEVLLHDTFAYGNINHQKGTVEVAVSMAVAPIAEEFRVINELKKLAESINKKSWPFMEETTSSWRRYYDLDFGKKQTSKRIGIWKKTFGYQNGIVTKNHQYVIAEPEYAVAAVIINEQGKQIGKMSALWNNGNSRETMFSDLSSIPSAELSWAEATSNIVSFTIKADDLTDTLTMRIVSVNVKSTGNGRVGCPRESAVLRAVAVQN